jgi:propanol-preferring alcohol dehydrogenase
LRAWELRRSSSGPRLDLVERAEPEPGPGQVLVQVEACGVCRTDLHLAAGELPLRRSPIVLGHEVVGRVVALGSGVERFSVGDRVGIAWLRHVCGRCRACRQGAENLCEQARFTGWDEDGGWAELAVVEEAWAYALPEGRDRLRAAPLLCAGIIGYRALRRAELPPAAELGLFGFGGSAHLTAQLAVAFGHRVHVFTRSPAAQEQARDLGAASAGPPDRPSPVPLDAVIVFSPDGGALLSALELTRPGGTVVAAGIHVEGMGALDYRRHLFGERRLTSATANTKADGEAFLRLAERLALEVHALAYPFDQAPAALDDLAAHRFVGAAVLDLAGP